jgi:prolipoprotein diacylglyceryltransferase
MHMFPILFSIGPVTLYTFTIFLVLAFFLTGYILWKKGKEEHYPEDELFDGFLLSILIGVLASRVGFILFHFDIFRFDVLKWLNFFGFPGTIPTFGFFAAMWWLFSFAKRKKWDAYEIIDFASIAVAFGYVLLWFGLLLDGSSFGNATNLPWGMTFPSVFNKHHPTQLYGFVLYLILFLYLYWVEGRYRTFEWYRDKRHSAQTGFLFCVFCITYGLYGAILGLLMPAQMVVFGVAIDVPLRLMFMMYGTVLLFVRAGRSFFPAKK